MMFAMKRGLVTTAVLACLALAACSSSDDAGQSSVEITLLPSSTAAPTETTESTTTTSTTTSTTTTTVVATTTTAPVDPAVADLQLSGDGIGTAGFGAEPEGVIGYLSSYLGPPDNDSGWVDPLSIGLCPGTELRQVTWGVLTLLFGDVSAVVDGRRHFFGYTYGDQAEVGAAPVGLVTTRGVGIGSRVIDVKAAYPAATINPEDEFFPPFFFVNDSLRGFLTGVDDAATVTAILGGADCGI
jgi:hypothetical protein